MNARMLAASMRRSAAFAALLVTFSSLAACAGAPPPPPAAPAQPPPPPAPPPPDLSAVPDPSGLVLTGSFGKLSASMAAVHGWTNLPMPQSEQVTELLTTEAIGPVIDLDQPVYFALTVVGSGLRMKPPLFAMSAAVKDPDKVKAALGDRYKLVPGDNGTTLIEGLGKPQHKAAAEDDDDDDDDGAKPPAGSKNGGSDDGDDDDHRTCELAPSFGDAPVRIVCGMTKKDMTTLGPWLTRTAPRTPAPADLHLDVRLAPLKETIAEGKKLIGAMLGSILGARLHMTWGRDLALAVVGDFADLASDMDGTTVDFTLSDSGATETATAQLSGTTSLIGRIAVAHPERNGPPPPAFWQMPADSDAAFFTRGLDDSLTAHARQLLTDTLGGALVQDGASDTDAKAVATAFGKLLTGAPVVDASGMDHAALRKALDAERSVGGGDAAARLEAKHNTSEELLGWNVLEVEQPTAPLSAAVKELAASMNKPSLLAARRKQDKEAGVVALRSAPVGKTAGLPAGTTQWILELPPPVHHTRADREGKKDAKKKPTPAAKPVLVHIFMAPDGARTWVGFGGDEAVVAAKLAASMGAGGDNLGGRAELASLKSASVGTAALLSARGLALLPIRFRLALGGSAFGASEALGDLEKMSDKGLSPIVVTSVPKAGGPPSVATGNVDIPRAFIEDVVTSFLRHGGI